VRSLMVQFSTTTNAGSICTPAVTAMVTPTR
jgi:hypothetical protein